MAIAHKYTLLCDDVRQETNGKFIILGLYTPDIAVPAVPVSLPSLCFFTVGETEGPEDVDLTFRLTQQNNDTVLVGGSGKMRVDKRGFVAIPLKFAPITLPGAGNYVFTIDIAGSASIAHEFSVTLAVQQLGQPTPARSVH